MSAENAQGRFVHVLLLVVRLGAPVLALFALVVGWVLGWAPARSLWAGWPTMKWFGSIVGAGAGVAERSAG